MKKLLVFMIDALCSSDIEYMKTLPTFKKIITEGSYVHHLLPVHPALTYCCHTSIVTGVYVDKHGITNNELLKRGCRSSDVWFGMKDEIKVPTLLDHARENNLTTCSINWPVSAKANYTYNMPMIVPYHYKGDHPEDYLYGNATDILMDKYWDKYKHLMQGPNHSLDEFGMALILDIIKDFGQSDVTFMKLCDLDTVRHKYGVYAKETQKQLEIHDEQLKLILEAIKEYGDIDNTHIVIMGDHGQTNIDDVLNMNKVLYDAGFISCDDDGNIISCDAYAHSAALTCFIELANPEDSIMEKKLKEFLDSLKDDKDIQLRYVLDKKEMKERYHLEGPFDFVIESKRNITFDYMNDMSIESIWRSQLPGDHIIGKASHGGSPEREEHTLFIASGPSIKKGVVVHSANMVDEAISMAKMIGFDMPNTDGKFIEDFFI